MRSTKLTRCSKSSKSPIGVVLIAAMCLVACALPAPSGPSGHLSLIGYSTPQEAYSQLIPAFQQTQAGRGVAIDPSFGASGTQTQAVIRGLDADLVALSLESDVSKLVAAGIV